MAALAQPIKNRLLAVLPPEVLSRLLPRMRSFSLSIRETLVTPDTPIAVYFVESGFVSLVASLDDGSGRHSLESGGARVDLMGAALDDAAPGTAAHWQGPSSERRDFVAGASNRYSEDAADLSEEALPLALFDHATAGIVFRRGSNRGYRR